MAKNLFAEFASSSYNDWHQQALKDLKGKPADVLQQTLRDGTPIQPLYTADTTNTPAGQPWPENEGWVTLEEIVVTDEEKANKQALEALNRGANGLLFYVFDEVMLSVLLRDVLMQHISIHFVVAGDAQRVLHMWVAEAKQRGLALELLNGSIDIDPIAHVARTGNWHASPEEDLTNLVKLLENAPPNIRSLSINNALFANAGATPAQQLGIALAHAHEYLLRAGFNRASSVCLNMAIGAEYFPEIAKFRAMRRLWAFLLAQYEAQEEPLYLSTETGIRNKTIYDPWVNMLRSTSEAMSAVIGGCDALLLRSYDATYRTPKTLGNRVARNQQLVLAYESYFGRVKDMAAGSYFIEALTEELAEEGWRIFKEIEALGGLIEALQSGYVQDIIERSNTEEQELFDAGKLPLLGTSIFPNKAENMTSEVTHPLYALEQQEPLTIRPVVPNRLSEKLERARLAEEEGLK
jgi:methylmalonyl-CoA mutase